MFDRLFFDYREVYLTRRSHAIVNGFTLLWGMLFFCTHHGSRCVNTELQNIVWAMMGILESNMKLHASRSIGQIHLNTKYPLSFDYLDHQSWLYNFHGVSLPVQILQYINLTSYVPQIIFYTSSNLHTSIPSRLHQNDLVWLRATRLEQLRLTELIWSWEDKNRMNVINLKWNSELSSSQDLHFY